MSSLNLTLSESNISVANNTSDVTVAVGVKFTDGWWAASDTGSSITISCNGTSKTLSFGPYNIGANGSKNFGSIKFSGIKHNSDGSKTVTASATWVVPFGNGYKVSGSANKTLTKIARASSISSISGSTLGSAITVNINRLNSGFTHTVTYKFGSITRSYTGQATACTFTPPLSDASQISQAVSGSATVSVQTYSGSTAIASAVSKVFTLNLPSSVLPSIIGPTITRVDNGVPAAWGVYVQGFSKANISIGGTGIYGSSIASYALSGGGYSSSNASLATGVLNTAGTNTFTGTIRDSRGRAVSKAASITVLEYSNPTAVITVERCNSNGTANTDGTYVKVIATFACASISGKNNIVSKTITIGNYTSTSFTSGSPVVLGGALSTDSSYTATLTIKDALGSSTIAKTTVPTGAVTMDFKAGGNGVAFGKVAEVEDIVDSAWPIRANGGFKTDYYYAYKAGDTMYNSQNIELYGNPPFIDFHAKNSTADYTSRIIDYGDNYLTCIGKPIRSDNGALLGTLQANTSEYIGLYDGTLNTRKGWIGHNSSNNLHITNEAGGRVFINCEAEIASSLTVKNVGYVRGYTVNGIKMRIGVVGDNDQVYIGDSETGTIIRGKSIKLGSTSGATVTSDANLKTDVKPINENYKNFFASLTPVSYKYDIEGHKRSHLGFIAQDVENALSNNGLKTIDFAGICIDEVGDYEVDHDDPDTKIALTKGLKKIYSLRYEEFISLNTAMIQEMIKNLANLKSVYNKKIEDLENRINQLEKF